MTCVFLADDHSIMRDGLKQILAETEDLKVTGEASNGNELLTRLNSVECNILVLDISMPGKNGIELIKLVHRDHPHLPILILSMHQEDQYALRAFKAGAAGYITKESDADLLVAAIRKVAAGGIQISPHVSELMTRQFGTASAALPHTLLSNREYQVFEMLVSGRSPSEIGENLSLSVKTVSTHKARIMQKMDMATVADLVRYAIAHELTSLPN
ncbi:MAG: response regulator transcription factor [Rhodocyclaceae bacterium]|jgi:DNA-binding NarL/FixJ family response regulator|nr:response regulator transcription factor [Rhodocyclaceae bacterium]